MALESNAWLTTNNTASNSTSNPRDQQNIVKSREDQLGSQQQFVTEEQQQRGLLKIPTSVGKISMFTQTEPTNRFTQTDLPTRYNVANNCLETTSNNVANCNKPGDQPQQNNTTMFDPSSMQQQQQQQPQNPQQNNTNPQQMYPNPDVKPQQQKDVENKNATVAEFPFCYNVNMLQKVQTQNTIPVSGITEDKGCYRFDVAQPFGYNYALVNQMSLAAAASSATFKCDVCGLVFGHLSLLNHHKRIHNTNVSNVGSQSNPERQYSCDICGACFNLAGELKSHKNAMHGKNSQQSQSAQKCCESCGVELNTNCEHQTGGGGGGVGKGSKKGKFVKCENCEDGPNSAVNSVVNAVSFVVASEAGQVRETVNIIKPGHHPVKRRGVASVTKCHKCNGSGIIFIGGTKNSSNVEKPFHCNVCDGTFSRYSSLWSHKRLHSGEKNFKCDICGLAFAKAAYLKNHNRVHTGEKPFKCSVCGMQFSQSPHLKNHERIHSGERPYQCEVCDKTFARHSTLWNHRRIHTGEKPYRCEVCGSAFNQATHLKNHAKVHTGEKPYRCDICDVGFSDRFALKRHRSIHEKYGRTAAQNGTASQSGQSVQPVQSVQQQQVNPAQANPVNSQPTMEHLYKCEVGGPIAFPGCSRPLEEKQ